MITSSTAAAVRQTNLPGHFTEADWNDEEVAQCREKGRDATALAKYRASKTLAERAAWAFYEEHKQELGWDLVALNPPFVFGPAIHEVDKPENLNESARDWYFYVVKGGLDNEALATVG